MIELIETTPERTRHTTFHDQQAIGVCAMRWYPTEVIPFLLARKLEDLEWFAGLEVGPRADVLALVEWAKPYLVLFGSVGILVTPEGAQGWAPHQVVNWAVGEARKFTRLLLKGAPVWAVTFRCFGACALPEAKCNCKLWDGLRPTWSMPPLHQWCTCVAEGGV